MKNLLISLSLVLVSATLLTGCIGGKQPEPSSNSETPVNESGMGNDQVGQDLPKQNLIEVASVSGSFNTLLAAVEKAGLSEELAKEEFTVFAPTDAAFAQLPEGALEELLADSEKLISVLKYHLLPGKAMANELNLLTAATTINGQEVKITADDLGLKVNNANVVQVDVMASNGVIHVIDSVLLPN
ncbi:MAG TPA: fasciclin domain-containing protein [Candidatus Woesebacteria bacterium]|nr:fasciclin domain-containing protein [Candidatus Woesebacteria bacterium]